MAFLLLRLQGPMQAWGTRSRFEYRDTEREPTFSGIIGMVAAAEGLPRGADLAEYHQLKMTVRVDREGELSREFQTAQNMIKADGRVDNNAQIIHRDYLSDASFHAALEGPTKLVKRIFDALQRPRYPLFLGRKSYVPSVPIIYPDDESYFDDGLDALDFLIHHPLVRHPGHPSLSISELDESDEKKRIRFVLNDTSPTGDTRNDIPIQFHVHRRCYGTRYVKTEYRSVPLTRDKGGPS